MNSFKKTGSLITLFLAGAMFSACGGDDDEGPDGGLGGATGSGGSSSGGSNSGGGDAGGAPGTDPKSEFVTDGLGESGDWKGYLWTAAETGSTIEPGEFTGDIICAEGTLGAAYEEWAMVGWNINQEVGEDGMGGDVLDMVPGGTGVTYSVENRSTTVGLRIQIQSTDESSWCAAVDEPSGTIPWDEFTVDCWEDGGEVYDPSTPISQISVQAYSPSNMKTSDFDYCVINLAPGE